nr:hypothetical protein [uncultured Halomonas sp.]
MIRTTRSRSALYGSKRQEQGQALVEVIICGALVIALVPGIVILFKYAQMRQFADELVRYTVWERTVWTDSSNKWNNSAQGEHQFVQAGASEIAMQGIARLSNPRQSLSSERSTTNAATGSADDNPVPWGISEEEQALLRLSDAKAGSLTGTERLSPSVVEESWGGPAKKLPAHILTGSFSVPVLGFERGLDINSDTLVTASIDVPLNNLYGNWPGLFNFSENALGVNMGEDIQLNARGAILTNGWTPKNEEVFCKKVHGLDVKPMLSYMTYANGAVDDLTSFIPDIAKHFIPFLSSFTQAGNPELHASTGMLPYIRALPFELPNTGKRESGVEGYGTDLGAQDYNDQC